MDSGLRGKVVLVTGVNNPLGIGAATAAAFAAEGAKVLGTWLPLPVKAPAVERFGWEYYEAAITTPPDGVVEAIRGRGGEIEIVPADLSDPAVVPRLFDRAEAVFGSVEVLVNNAAVDEPDSFLPTAALPDAAARTPWDSPVTPFTAGTHDRHFAVNSRGAGLMMAEFARRAIARGARGGRVVNVSTDGASAFGMSVSYGASKLALEAFSRAAALELGRYGIAVNVVSPGPIQTGYIDEELEAKVSADTPLGRVGRPEDVADVVVFLASEQARWLTGQLLYVGGGHRMPRG